MQSTFSKRNTFGARTECPSYKQSNKGIRERKGTTVDVRFAEIPVLQKIPLLYCTRDRRWATQT